MIAPRSKLLLLLSVVALLAGAILWFSPEEGGQPRPSQTGELPALGLMTSLPIFWNEAASIDEMLETGGEIHWARTELERSYRLVPLDTLAQGGGLGDVDLLLMAQPRALAPAENVALDEWVRGGGRLLLFADPLLTGHSRFHIGDRRRPQDVALLSPILSRWGLELLFDENQDATEKVIEDATIVLPVQLAGRWKLSGEISDCELSLEAVVSTCSVGKGRVVAVADAAMLEVEHGHDHGPGGGGNSRGEALAVLLSMAFDSK